MAQFEGLGTLVRDLGAGALPILVGSRETFVPVIAVDYLASFLAAVPEYWETAGKSSNILDGATPLFPNLVTRIAMRLGTRAPRLTVPVGLVRRLPRSITKVEPETLSFIASDTYPTSQADEFAARAGLVAPDVGDVIDRWVDYLIRTKLRAETDTKICNAPH